MTTTADIIADPETVQSRARGRLGTITLARVGALNALTTEMVERIGNTLADWQSAGLAAVVLRSASPKAFCAGGDIRTIARHSQAGDEVSSARFFSTEYELNARIAEYPVPIMSFIDGICMGGGLGLSAHGRFRVVTENALLAMPETSIGFFPDIGASYFLPRLPGALGTYLGLTGAQLGPADALYCGLATHFVASTRLGGIAAAIEQDRSGRPIEEILRSLGGPSPVGESELARHRADIDWCFGAPTLPEIQARLAATVDQEWAAKTRHTLARLSPQSLQITLELLTRGSQQSLRECLAAELEVAREVIKTPDFIEGVRAALVDKDRSPSWGTSRFEGFSPTGEPRWRSDGPATHPAPTKGIENRNV
ncbi:enoyl-CoA hydratase/isomerase family protein [Arthrobacter sp. UYEF3]|uniref:enoyl-CoA hydratase/isomerase family protein n=1 Tax=Arthrobacter sp. UYEF3 TaxID=1756365 RepID=UPI003396AEA3